MSVELQSQRGKTTRPQFFKVLCAESLLKMKIPSDFMKYIETKRTVREAILLSPLVKIWHVVVERREQSNTMFFGRGWQKFVEAHSLRDGNMVAFRYEGNMVFTVKIFRSDGCRARYSNTDRAVDCALREQTVTSSSSCAPSSLNSEALKSIGTKRKIAVKAGADELPNTTRCNQASESILKWEVAVTDRLLSSGRLNIPKRLTCLDQFSRDKDEVIVTDSRGRKWPIRLTLKTERGFAAKGWRLLATDVCFFEFVSDELIKFRVEKKRQPMNVSSGA